MPEEFLYIELAHLTAGKAFDALVPGTFIDMLGRKVTFKKSELQTYLKNTLAAIKETTTESGESTATSVATCAGDGMAAYGGSSMSNGLPVVQVAPATVPTLLTPALSVAVVGFHTGLDGERNLVAVLALVLVTSAVILLIVDLDRPQEGLLQVSQQTLIDVQRQIEAAQ